MQLKAEYRDVEMLFSTVICTNNIHKTLFSLLINVFKKNVSKEEILDDLMESVTAHISLSEEDQDNNVTYRKLRTEVVKNGIDVPETNLTGR